MNLRFARRWCALPLLLAACDSGGSSSGLSTLATTGGGTTDFVWTAPPTEPPAYTEPTNTTGTLQKPTSTTAETQLQTQARTLLPTQIVWCGYYRDTDGDGLTDGYEVDNGFDPNDPANPGWGVVVPLGGAGGVVTVANSTVAPAAATTADASGAAAADTGGEDARTAYSTTTLQEADVDEADTMKNDGASIFVISGNTVRIVRAYPASGLSEAARIDFGQAAPVGLYLADGRLMVLYQGWDPFLPGEEPRPLPWVAYGGVSTGVVADIAMVGAAVPCYYYNPGFTGVRVYDVADPSRPLLLLERRLEGSLVASRRIDTRLHVVLQSAFRMPFRTTYCDGETPDAVLAGNQAIANTLTSDQVLPRQATLDAAGAVVSVAPLVMPGEVYLPILPSDYGFVTIYTLDLAAGGFPSQAVAAEAAAHIVYASRQALYLAGSGGAFDVLPMLAADGTTYEPRTTVHKFSLGAEVKNTASGSVRGTLLNQYSLGEFQNTLRIATTTDSWSSTGAVTTLNHVFCLQNSNGQLAAAGSIEGLAPTERIYAARFIDERGFLVTFRRIDPLFTLDLSDPAAPRVAGELKIPGYSDYLHPLGRSHIIGVGKDADAQGAVRGVQLTLFDVSDLAQPALLHKVVIGTTGTDSEALRDPKAFTFWAAGGNLLALPVTVYEGSTAWTGGAPAFSGLYVYRVSPAAGFEFLGRIADGGQTVWYGAGDRRGVFIGDEAYLVSSAWVRAAPIGDLSAAPFSLDFVLAKGLWR